MKRSRFAWILLVACPVLAQTGDILGVHDLSTTASPVRGAMSAACLYCHAPHSGASKALWNQTLSTQTYTQLYTSDTVQNTPVQPALGERSSLCLSCHDGTIAPGQMIVYGPITLSQQMSSGLVERLESSHPFSLKLPLKDAANLVESLVASGTTADPTDSVKLIGGNVECSSCHNPHNQAIDKKSQNFLVRENVSGGVCLSCHTTRPRTVNSLDNPLTQWTTSVHATSAAVVNAGSGLGGYSTVAEFACTSCHSMHNAGGAAGLLRNPVPTVPNVDTTSQSCISCHDGGNALLLPIANVFREFQEKKGHPFANGTNPHTATEPAVLHQNRHTTCVDCHNGHASQPVTAFGLPPVIRPSQTAVTGVSAGDGVTIVRPAINQYETCLRCHGTSTGKGTPTIDYGPLPRRAVAPPDPLNILPDFALTATSTHPVMRDRSSPLPQPSLLLSMSSLDGTTAARAMGVRLFCTDCHNSDDNREFGGAGPNGPHGSRFVHILERRYEITTATAPGGPLLNAYPNPDLSVNGPYALCGKCHDLTLVLSPGSSFLAHSKHVSDVGASCSVCHSAHGVSGATGGMSGERLVNFDLNVVTANGATPISFNQAARTCTLQCHSTGHSGQSY